MDQKLLTWSLDNFQQLPWRVNRSLYTTLVSEIMLQQTTVQTVLNHYPRFIAKYPDIESLAAIEEPEMLKAWSGLGYYRRARNLLSAAKTINEKYQGNIPLDYEKLISIKGIGQYTANALLAIGANKPALALDANLERVLARYYKLESVRGAKLQNEIQAKFLNSKICTDIESLGSRNLNEALMDLGRVICKARSASCELCPIAKGCLAKGSSVLKYPRTKAEAKQKESFDIHLLRVIVSKNNHVLSYKKNKDQWLSGQYEIPSFILECSDEDLKQYPKLVGANLHLLNLPYIVTAITKYKIYNHILVASEKEAKTLGVSIKNGYIFSSSEDHHLSTASLKCLKFMGFTD